MVFAILPSPFQLEPGHVAVVAYTLQQNRPNSHREILHVRQDAWIPFSEQPQRCLE
jgi:hypothetical protein